MTPSNLDLLRQSHRTGAQFLLASLQVAFTYLDIAEASKEDDIRSRNVQNARLIYVRILRLMPRIIPLAEESMQLGRKMAELRSRLIYFAPS